MKLSDLFKRKEKTAMSNPETNIPMSEEERARHEASEGIRQQLEHERVMRETEKGVELTPEEIERAQEKAKEREETRPWGQ